MLRCDRRKKRHAGDDRGHGGDLAPPDRLVQDANGEPEQNDEPQSERRLDERQRRDEKRGDVKRPPERREHRPAHPERPADEAAKEREPKRVLERDCARLEGLQRDTEVVKRRRAERGYYPDELGRH